MPRGKQSLSDEPDSLGIVPLTYDIRPTENAKALTITVRCCLCNTVLERQRNGWCENCNAWPINVTPVRYCSRAHKVATTGWCHTCTVYVLTELEAYPGEWMDTGRVPRKLTKIEVSRLAKEMAAKLSGPGWPEKEVPLRIDMVPKGWKRRGLKVVGQTPLGYDIVLPVDAADDGPSEEVPF